MLTRRLICWGGEGGVPPASPTATRYDEAVTRLKQLTQHLPAIAILHGRTWRHSQHQVLPGGARLLLSTTVPTTLRPIMLSVVVVEQGGKLEIRYQQNVTTAPTVASIGSAAGNVLLPPEGQAAVAAVAGVGVDDCLVDEHGLRFGAGDRPELFGELDVLGRREARSSPHH